MIPRNVFEGFKLKPAIYRWRLRHAALTHKLRDYTHARPGARVSLSAYEINAFCNVSIVVLIECCANLDAVDIYYGLYRLLVNYVDLLQSF
jgi:hypothetical protein